MKKNLTNSAAINASVFGKGRVALPEGVAQYKKVGSSAVSQVSYMTISKAIKSINIALEKDGATGIGAPELKFELAAAGFEKFAVGCLDYIFEGACLVLPSDGNDINLCWGKLDEEDRRRWQVRDLVRSFEWKFRAEIAAAKAGRKAEKAAKRAEKAAKSQAKKETREALAADIAAMAIRQAEAALGRKMKDDEIKAINTTAAKQAATLTQKPRGARKSA